MDLPVDRYSFPLDWKIDSIDKIAEFNRGISWRKIEEADSNEGILVISIPNIQEGKIDFDSKYNHYISKKVPETKRLYKGDIVFVGSSGSIHNVGRNALVISLPEDEIAFASFTFKAHKIDKQVDNNFLYYLLNSSMSPFDRFCKRAADGKFNFQLRDYESKLRVPMPPLPEQRRIAAVLSLVQKAIEEQKRLIELTTELKKTLMHKLFTEGTRGEPQK
ncbi:MAG: restriction endonuclease subunit S, partial [Syntrophaceae bacterium]|nr:restriction endonuclease subunit S [Syntrophaceae bacterium]